MADEKVVELSMEDFQEMVQHIKELKLYIQTLEDANEYLNSQIDDYNEKFGTNT